MPRRVPRARRAREAINLLPPRVGLWLHPAVHGQSAAVDAEPPTRTINARMSQIRDAVIDLNENISEYQAEQAWREKKASEMLDNIQRGRKPLVDPSPII